MDREGDPLDKPVMEIWLVVVFRAKSCLEEILILISFLFGGVCEGMAVGRSPSQTIFRDGGILQTPGVEIIESHGFALSFRELLLEEFLGELRDEV